MIVDTVIEDPRWETALPGLAGTAETAARAALAAAGRRPEGWTLCLLACDDARIAGLNGQFRGRAAPTNVLSWPAFAALPPDPAPGAAPLHLGDLAIALETTQGEAISADLPLKDHALHLILHGCLHLLGYDHESEAEAVVMEGIETRVLTGLGLADPYSRRGAPEAYPE